MKISKYLSLDKEEFIKKIITTYPEPETLEIVGNRKLGKAIAHISGLPYHDCPSKSEWCMKKCYGIYNNRKIFNCSEKSNLMVKAAYYSHLSNTNPEKLSKVLIRTFNKSGYYIFRIHVDGDFFTVGQIEAYISAIKRCKHVKVFFFTRSWNNSELLPYLNKLKSLPNVKGFASVDFSMDKQPPSDWLSASIVGHFNNVGIVCPEQLKKVENCIRCGICFNKRINKNILFFEHS